MKWFYLVAILIVAGILGFYVLREPVTTTDTPEGTARMFVASALNDDMGTVESICGTDATAKALRIAQQIRDAAPDARSFKWKPTPASNAGLEAVTAVFEGKVLTIEMVGELGYYQIERIDLSE